MYPLNKREFWKYLVAELSDKIPIFSAEVIVSFTLFLFYRANEVLYSVLIAQLHDSLVWGCALSVAVMAVVEIIIIDHTSARVRLPYINKTIAVNTPYSVVMLCGAVAVYFNDTVAYAIWILNLWFIGLSVLDAASNLTCNDELEEGTN